MKQIIILFNLLISVILVKGQTGCDVPGNYCMSNDALLLCGGTLYDAGGGDAYPDENFELTICTNTPGDVVQLSFTAFALQTSPNPNSSDYLTIFDGPTTLAPSLGSYTGNDLQGISVTGTVFNTTGCLTLVFSDNGLANTGFPGFQASIACATPCANPTSSFQTTAPAAVNQGGSISVCVGETVAFDGSTSFAEQGFSIAQYSWNFDDGTLVSETDPIVEHAFNEPGEYLVNLTVFDNNGCASLNIIPIQVLVSTQAQFGSIADIGTEYCFGQTVTLNAANVTYPTWSSLPESVVAGVSELADGAGFSYDSPLSFDFFDDGAVLQSCDELGEIFINMEHSFLGDLGITITCPNNTIVTLLDPNNLGGPIWLGEPVDDESTTPGIGYDYSWAPTATLGTMDEEGTGSESLPPGTYSSFEDMCDLVGCPLNGTWTITVTDDAAFDNGYIFEWGINFDPSLYPGVTTFTPTFGGGADSSYWTGPNIEFLDAGHDQIELLLTEPGTYEYVYNVTNNFGCQNDTSIVIVIEPPVEITAGPDIIYACEPVEIQGGYLNIPTPSCSNDSGIYDYCYGDNELYVVTYCPDTPGDENTSMSITFLSGEVETSYDFITIYDGASTSSPILLQDISGELAGITAVATNPGGCITLELDSDGIFSCESGTFPEGIQYEVGCADPNNFVWSWSPAAGLSSTASPTPTLETISETTVFTLTGYPEGFPECASSDQMEVTVNLSLEVEILNDYSACVGNTVSVSAPEIIGGAPDYAFTWTLSDGTTFSTPEFDYVVNSGVEACVEVMDGCNLTAQDCTTITPYPSVPATFDLIGGSPQGCSPHTISLESDYTAYQNLQSMWWHFSETDSVNVLGTATFQFTQAGDYLPYLVMTDLFGCVTSDTLNNEITVVARPIASFFTTEEIAYLPETSFNVINTAVNASNVSYLFDQWGSSSAFDTIFSFPADTRGVYVITQIAYNELGCTDTTQRIVSVKDDIDLFIPNSFTPDGDGVNDVWLIKGGGFTSRNYEVTIYNRWGQPVFKSTDPTEPWLGETNNGSYFSQDAVYLYFIKIQDIENDVRYEYQGHITVIR